MKRNFLHHLLCILLTASLPVAAQPIYLQSQKLTPSDRAANAQFGAYLSISGNRMAVGAYQEGKDANGSNLIADAGAVYIYERSATTGAWVQGQKLVASDRQSGAYFGTAVALSGNRLAVGAICETKDAAGTTPYTDAGAVYIFDRNTSTGVWAQTQKIVASDRYAPVTYTNGLFGYSIALSGDRIVVGSFRDGKDAGGGNILASAGSAFIFDRSATTGVWAQTQKLAAGDRQDFAYFGNSVSISGNRILVGAYSSSKDANGNPAGTYSGGAYIYDLNTSTGVWAQTQKIVASDQTAMGRFGGSVSLSGDRLVAGTIAESRDAGGLNSLSYAGAAYIFDRNTTNGVWMQSQKIVGTNRESNGYFGEPVIVDGDRIYAGSRSSTDAAGAAFQSAAGAVYTFARNSSTGVWAQSQKIVAADRASSALYSVALGVSRGIIAIGANGEAKNAAGTNSLTYAGAAYTARQQNALNLDGSNDYVALNANPVAASGEMTFEGWVNWNGGGSWQRIMDFGNSAGNNISFTPANSVNGKMRFVIGIGGVEQLIDGAMLSTGAWHHVAVTTTAAGVWTMYLDGVQVAQNSGHTYTPASLGSTANNWLGKSQYADPYFNGSLDEVRIWNRALCQQEIAANMNGELPSIATQTGLVSYYQFDQGDAGMNNTDITTLIESTGNTNSGTLINIAGNGNTSNFITGTPLVSGFGLQYAPTAPSASTEAISKTISGTTLILGCGAIATIAPTGGSAVSGMVTAKVTIDGSVASYGNHAYVQRHYDITPANNAAAATGTITLYFTQADFEAYNAANGTDPDLPANSSDAAGIANIRVTQYHGSGTTPGTYSGAALRITPTASYNTMAARWELSFPVTGFSGFFVTGDLGAPLPVRLVAFTAQPAGKDVRLNWSVAEQKNMASYTIERSRDGAHFSPLSSLAAMAQANEYTATDNAPFSGSNYYRLRMEGLDGTFTYSHTERVIMSGDDTYFHLSPVPANTTLSIETNDVSLSGTIATLADMSGRKALTFTIMNGSMQLSLDGLQAGIYMLRLANGDSYKVVKR